MLDLHDSRYVIIVPFAIQIEVQSDMTADELIKVLSERLNVEGLSFGDQLVAGISVDDMAIDFEKDEDDAWLYVHGEVVKDAWSLPKERILSLLKAHHLFNDVPNASFGISRDDALELFMRVPLIDGLSADDWMAMFLSFLVSLKEWRAELGADAGAMQDQEDLHSGESALPPEEGMDGGETSFGFLGGIRV